MSDIPRKPSAKPRKPTLADALGTCGISRCDRRELYRYRIFYLAYPQIVETLSPQLTLSGLKLVDSLSFSHFAELIDIQDPLKRAFYEIECIRGNWSVRELKRQIATLYYERSGLSRDKEKLADMAHAAAEKAEPKLAIRDPYVFEFLGLKASETSNSNYGPSRLKPELHTATYSRKHVCSSRFSVSRYLIVSIIRITASINAAK